MRNRGEKILTTVDQHFQKIVGLLVFPVVGCVTAMVDDQGRVDK